MAADESIILFANIKTFKLEDLVDKHVTIKRFRCDGCVIIAACDATTGVLYVLNVKVPAPLRNDVDFDEAKFKRIMKIWEESL